MQTRIKRRGEGKEKKRDLVVGAPEKASWSPSRTWIDLDGVCVCCMYKSVRGPDKKQEGKTRLGIRADGSGTKYSFGLKVKGARAEKKEIQANRLLT